VMNGWWQSQPTGLGSANEIGMAWTLWAGLPGGSAWPLLLLLAIVAAGCVVFMLRQPDAGTWVFAAVLYSNCATVAIHFHGVPSWAGGATIGLLLFPVAYHILLRGGAVRLGPAPLALMGFFAAQFLGVFVAPHRDIALKRLFENLAEGLVLYLLVANAVRTPELLRRVVWSLLIAGAAMGGLGLFQAATKTPYNNYGGFAQMAELDFDEENEDYVARPKPRASGPIGEKNYYAQFMLMLAPLAFMQRQSEATAWGKLAAIGSLLMILAGVALSGSRGAAVGFVAVVFVMAAFRYVSWLQVGLVGLAATLVVALTPSYRERLETLRPLVDVALGTASIQNVDKAIQGRATEMVAAVQIFAEHPLLGVGPGNFGPVFLTKADILGFQIHSQERLAHCMYLEIAAENGLAGLGCWLVLFVSTLRELQRVRNHAKEQAVRNAATGLFLSLVVLASTGVFLSFAYTRYYWFMLALAGAAAALGETVREPVAKEERSTGKLEVA
jgi:putative inorganic carbon (HCO3(-)) transporter